ncbi:hypothetical protein [Virgibacillus sp. JSM 102003]|uniref:hypothetical protein n=1 Tax=Virgibacillus sp. JSM 102003 TaxID=1562108 RepID=UPI0035C11153
MLRRIVYFFKENSWETVCFTQNLEEYGRVKGNLNDAGIITKTKTATPMNGNLGSANFSSTYDIKVKQKYLHKAQEAIHKSRY